MDILLGVGIFAASVLLFSWAFGSHRRPNRAAWVSWPGCSMLVCVAFTFLGPLGLGLLIRGMVHPLTDLSHANLAVIAFAAVATLLAVWLSPSLIRSALGVGTAAKANAEPAAPVAAKAA